MPPPGPDDYDDKRTYSPFYYVPPLQFMCIARLVQHPQGIEAIHTLQLAYQSGSKQKFDILRAFIPTYDPEDPLRQLSLSSVDPRLWAVLIQVYSHLPDSIRTYRIPLSDKHVPLLQRIPSTPNFTLLTILELPDCPELTDNTVQELRYLDGLTALDASRTMLSADAVRILVSTCNWGDDEAKRGPWGLRILCLRECRHVDDRVFKYISGFRLLSVADLRGTRCRAHHSLPPGFHPAPQAHLELYHPTSIGSSLGLLSHIWAETVPSANIFTLYIDSLYHGSRVPGFNCRRSRLPARPPDVTLQNAYVVLPPRKAGNSGEIQVGSSDALDREKGVRRHEENKEAWYRRNPDKLDNRWPSVDGNDPFGGGIETWSLRDDPWGDHEMNDEFGEGEGEDDGNGDEEEAEDEEEEEEEEWNQNDGVADDVAEEDSDPNADEFALAAAVPWLHPDNLPGIRATLVAPSGERPLSQNEASIGRNQLQTEPIVPPSCGSSTQNPVNTSGSTHAVLAVVGAQLSTQGMPDATPNRSPVGRQPHTINDPINVSRPIQSRLPNTHRDPEGGRSNTMPSMDWREDTAQEVAAQQASERAVADFYRCNPSAPTRGFTHKPVSDQDRLLMLFRKPPPWSALEGITEATVAEERRLRMGQKCDAGDAPLSINRTSAKAMAILGDLERLKRLRTTALKDPDAHRATRAHPPSNSRINIFRQANATNALQMPRAPTIPEIPECRVSGGPEIKISSAAGLRPISSLPKPTWPEKTQDAVVGEPRPSTAKDRSRRVSKKPANEKAPDTRLREGPLDMLLKVSKSKAGPSVMPIKPRNTVRAEEVTDGKAKGFDWKGWGSK